MKKCRWCGRKPKGGLEPSISIDDKASWQCKDKVQCKRIERVRKRQKEFERWKRQTASG